MLYTKRGCRIMDNNNRLKEYMLKEIEIIQEIIKRIAFNSFMIKGWAITLFPLPQGDEAISSVFCRELL